MPEKEMPRGPAARFFEDFSEGDEFVTQGRTVTETDLLNWAMFTGDMNPMHVDEDFASKYGLFGGRFPPGLMSVAIASGLWERLGLTAGTGLAVLERKIRYRSIILVGDTIHVTFRVKKLESRPGKASGKIFWYYEIVKGDGEVAIEGEWLLLVASKNDF
jgi:acyl dehydratase